MPSMTAVLGRGLAALLVLSLTPARPALAQAAQTDDDWCRQSYSGRQASYCEVREESLPGLPSRVDVDGGQNGGIAVEAWDRPDVVVRARVVGVADTDAEARQVAADVRLATESGRIRAEGPSRSGDRNWWVSWRVSVPRSMPLKLTGHNGGVSVTGVHAAIDVETQNGGLHLTDLGGHVRAETRNGGVNVALSGTRWDGDLLDVETTNGGVHVAVPDGYAAHLETGTTNGGIRIDFPVTVQGRINRNISTDLNGGGPTIRVMTRNGGVRIERR